jgi:hypothetical protein
VNKEEWNGEDEEYSDDVDGEDFSGMPMPIMDTDYTEENSDPLSGPIMCDDKEPDFSKMQGLDHLKLGKGDKIDIRKGISIEKTMKIKEDGKPGVEFDVIQHENSNFEGVQGKVIKQSKQSKAAL